MQVLSLPIHLPVRECPVIAGDARLTTNFTLHSGYVVMEAWQTLEHTIIRCGVASYLTCRFGHGGLNKPTPFRGKNPRIWRKNLRLMDYQAKPCICWISKNIIIFLFSLWSLAFHFDSSSSHYFWLFNVSGSGLPSQG